VLVSLLTTGAFATPAVAQDPGPAVESSFPPEVTASLDGLFELYAERHVPGTVLAVSVEGQGRYIGVEGTAGLDDPAPISAESRFHIGSITKTFTATAVLQLVDECRLRLDDTIERWQPAVPEASRITVHELLNHTSGIPDYGDTTEFNDVLDNDPLRDLAPQQLVDLAATLPRPFAPGTEWMYSNTNYVILGLIVEAVTGQTLEHVIQQRILDPLHLGGTSFPTTAANPDPATSGSIVVIDGQGKVVQEAPFNLSPSLFWAAGAMVSTVGDLETWARALVDGTLLSPETQRARLTLVPTLGPDDPDGLSFPPLGGTGPTLPVHYGLGIFGLGGYIGHNGDIPGYEAIMVFDPQTRTLVVELQNARIYLEDAQLSPTPFDEQLPTLSVPAIAGILGQDPPLPPNPDGPTTPPCGQPPPPPTTAPPPPSPGSAPRSEPAHAVRGTPTFTG